MKGKKWIALILCLAMAFGCLAGCGSGDGPSSGTAGSSAAEEVKESGAESAAASTESSAASTESPSEESQAEEEIVPGQLPLADPAEGKTLTIGVYQYPTTEDFATNAYTLWLEEQTGIHLEFVPFDLDEAPTQLSLMMAGHEKLPDIITAGIPDIMTLFEYGEDGYLVDLNPYIDKYGYYMLETFHDVTNEKDREVILSNGYDPNDGALYGFPHYVGPSMDSIGTIAYINKTWLDKLGADIPTTPEELYDVMKRFATEDPNGNGQADEIPMLGYVNGWRADIAEFLVNSFVYASDTYIFNVDDNGKLWDPYDTDEYREAMKYLNRIYTEGMLSPLFYTITTGSEMQSLVTPPDGVSLVGVLAAHPALCCVTDSENFKDYVALPPLKDCTGRGGYAVWRNNSFDYTTAAITTDCEDPDLAFRFMDFTYMLEAELRERHGVLGEDWDWAKEGATDFKGDPAYIDVIDASVFGSQNNKCWHYHFANIYDATMNNYAYTDDGSWNSIVNAGFAGIWKAYKEAPVPKNVLPNLVYTPEESEKTAEYQTNIGGYIEEARAMFASGVMDPNSDADWEAYVSNLKQLGIEDYMAIAQQAYDRMAG